MSERVILAYSGGLDTSVAISWIGKETGREVVAVAIDLGQGGEDMEVVRQRALDCGAVEAVVVDARDEFADELLPAHRPEQRAVHGPLPAGVGDQPAADRQAPGRGRARARRQHRRARLHRQGQRPGPVRGRIRFAGTGSGGAGAGPRLRVDAGEGDRVRRGERHPDQRHQALAVLDRPERLGPRGGNRLPGAPVERAHQGRLLLHRRPDRQLEHPRRGDRRFRAGRAGIDRRQAGVDAAGHRGTQPPRRRAGRRAPRCRRGPAGGHQEPRDLRGARGDGAHHRAHRTRTRHAGARAGPVQTADRPALGRAGVRRAVVLAAEGRAGEFRRQDPGARVRRGPNGVARRPHRGQRPAQRRVAVRLQPGHLRRGRHLRPVHVARASSTCTGCRPRSPPAGTARRADAKAPDTPGAKGLLRLLAAKR